MGLVKTCVYQILQILTPNVDTFPRYPQLVGTRVCLGVTEAGLFPGVVY